MRIVSAVLALIVLFPVCPSAQVRELPEDGSRLRLKMAGKTGTYLLEHIGADTLYVNREKDSEPMQISFNRVEKAEVRVPRSKGWGAFRGALIGGAIGGAIGAAVGIAKWNEPDAECGIVDPFCDATFGMFQFVGYVTIFGFPGMAVGGLVGALSPGERRQKIDLKGGVSLRFDRGGAMVVQYKRSF